MNERIGTGRLRRRLTIAFLLVSGLSAGVLAGTSFALARNARLTAFVDRATRGATINFLLARDELDGFDRSRLEGYVNRFRNRSGVETLIVGPQASLSSRPGLGTEDIPADLVPPEGEPVPDELPRADVTVDSTHYEVVAAPRTESGVTMFFFYSREAVDEDMRELGSILLRSWLVVVAGSALAGNILARRTLAPVARASGAARSLAEGLLDTRLPVDTHDEFGAWAHSFNSMADALQEKIRQLTDARERERRFTSDVSHELRTPLTALLTSASLLAERSGEMTPDTRWAAERVIEEARRLRGLLDELLEISRLDAGRESIRIESVDLSALVTSVISTRGWDESVTVHADPVVVRSDRRRLERVLANLISNAVIHGRKGVAVLVGLEDEVAVVQVTDRGPGIAPEHVDRLFERFYKVDGARSGGSGLGLSIARENALLLGGSIEVDTEPAGGTTFKVRLPLAPATAAAGMTVNGPEGE